ncbi:sphingosine kinase 1 isoform X2 [Mauremys mutica]|uniref:sphingosine kinase 1 isoform X2 n=1 Tax=Mauremys mutica TaxID=74926 RepID=UPI001D15F7A4|nr:sphingosine kinase 1 isoform X2 [Mauremys mutica]
MVPPEQPLNEPAMEGGQPGPGASSPQSDSDEVLLHGVFALLDPAPKTSYALSLTRGRELRMQRVGSAPAGRSAALKLADCIGCSAFAGREPEPEPEPAAYFSVFCYPFRKGWWDAAPARQRLARTFRVCGAQEPGDNLKLAETWAGKIRELAAPRIPRQEGVTWGLLSRPCHVLVLLNPQSGTGHALQLFHSLVQPMLDEADVAFTLFVTERPNHARELVRAADLSQWDAVAVLAGDGLLYEVVNGLMERQDWQAAIKKPLCTLPGGSGNALAASINHYAGNTRAFKEELLTNCTYFLCKGLHAPMDLVSLSTASGKRLYSFLSFGWGFISDVDIASEKYRQLGNARFTVGTIQQLAGLKVYKGRLSYLPVETSSSVSSAPGSPSEQNSHHVPCSNGRPLHILPQPAPRPPHEGSWPEDSLLVPFDQPVPKHWTVVPEEEFISIFAIYQSHLGADFAMAPTAKLHDGAMHLFCLKAGVSRLGLLRLFLAMEKGTHLDLNCPHLHYVPVRAFRLEPFASTGLMTVDGEPLACEPVQGQVHDQLCRIISGS